MQTKGFLSASVVSVLLLLGQVVSAKAVDGVAFAAGHGVCATKVLRLGVQWQWQRLWFQQDAWQLGGYWEPSIYYLSGKAAVTHKSNKTISALAFAPVFRLSLNNTVKYQPYLEFAVGVAQMNKREMGGRKLGIHFQFEDRLGFGLKFGPGKRFDLAYKVVHFSNAFIGPQNHGLNMHFIELGYWL